MYLMTFPLFPSLPLPFVFLPLYPPPPLLNVHSWCLPSPSIFLSTFWKCLCKSPSGPDGGAADKNVTVPWRQPYQCSLESRRQALRHWRTERTVLSVCKWTIIVLFCPISYLFCPIFSDGWIDTLSSNFSVQHHSQKKYKSFSLIQPVYWCDLHQISSKMEKSSLTFITQQILLFCLL